MAIQMASLHLVGVLNGCTGGDSRTDPYLTSHYQLLAHAATAKLYNTKYQDRTREITVLAMSCNARDEPGFVFTTFEKAGRAMSIRYCFLARDGDGSSFLDYGLSEVDPEVHAIIDKEKDRQFKSLELIAS
ncbi:hypothetical protein JHK87_033947 [Glycine soja]|nr:hypothetical protein JHK87_033947 [Glycine soja]